MATISGKWKFGENITFENSNPITVNFTSSGQSFTAMAFLRTDMDSYYAHSVLYMKGTDYLYVYQNDSWIEEYQTVDFGEGENVSDEDLAFITAIAVKISEESGDTEDPENPENPENPEETNTISGVYRLAEDAILITVDQRVNFTYNGDKYVGVMPGVNEDGDPVTYFEYADGGYLAAQIMGGWNIDRSYTIDFGETPQTVSEEFLDWVKYSLVVKEPTTISGLWHFYDIITLADDFANYDADVKFISNGELFNRISFRRTDIDLAYSYSISYTNFDEHGDMVHEKIVYVGTDLTGSWTEGYQTIDFIEPQKVSDKFYALMEKSAQKLKISNMGFKNGSSFICPILDPIMSINDKLLPYLRFYVRLSDVPEEVVE